MRSRGVPPRAAATIARRAARTSSSASETVTTRVRSTSTIPSGAGPFGSSAPGPASHPTDRTDSASAAGSPQVPATTTSSVFSASACNSPAPWRVSLSGR